MFVMNSRLLFLIIWVSFVTKFTDSSFVKTDETDEVLADPTDGIPVTLQPCNGTDPAQHWSFDDGRITNTNQFPITKCFDIHQWDTKDGAILNEWHCTTTKFYNEQFIYKEDTNTIVSSEKMLSKCIVSMGLGPGSHCVMWDCSKINPSEHLSKWLIDSKTSTIRSSKNPNLCLSTIKKSPSNPCSAPFPFCNTSLTFKERVKDLVARLTLEEKITQLSSGLNYVNPSIPRLGVPQWAYHSEGLHGLRTTGTIGLHITLFPQVTAMAATGNASLMRLMGEVMAVEARAANNLAHSLGKIPGKGSGLSYWSPTMNIIRDPRWGRSQESVSEDPYLNGVYAVNFVKGFQGDAPDQKYLKVGACCKHLWAYSLENSEGVTRHNFNAIVSQQDSEETYLPAFKACVQEANPSQVMCAYNRINGIPACLHGDVQNDILRTQWNFDGFIVSDCDAISDAKHFTKTVSEAVATGLSAGCDLDCGSTYKDNMGAAYKQGLVTNKTIDTAVERIFLLRFRLGEFDPDNMVPWKSIPPSASDTPEHQAIALQAAQESIILLANNESPPLLPLKASSSLKVAVIGPFWNNTRVMMGAKGDYNPSFVVSVYEGLQKKGVQLTYSPGCKVSGNDKSGFSAAEKVASASDVTILVIGIDSSIESEGKDRKSIALPGIQQNLTKTIAQVAKKLVVVLLHGGSVSVDWIKSNVDTVVSGLEGGEHGGTALADVLFGDINPSGVLPYTIYPANYVNLVKMTNMSMRAGPGRTYRFYTGQPLWPFGFGMSYTTFQLDWSMLPNATFTTRAAAQHQLVMKVKVTNTGKYAGAKVVQAFVKSLSHSNAVSAVGGSLFGFEKISLSPGKSETITFKTSAKAKFCTFCTYDGKMHVQSGKYEIFIGITRELSTHVIVSGATF